MLKVQEIRELIKLIDESSIHEFTYEEDGTSVTMKKSNGTVQKEIPVISETPQPVQSTPPPQMAQTEPENRPSVDTPENPVEKEEIQTDYDYEITSPMVGTLYSASTPESEPFV